MRGGHFLPKNKIIVNVTVMIAIISVPSERHHARIKQINGKLCNSIGGGRVNQRGNDKRKKNGPKRALELFRGRSGNIWWRKRENGRERTHFVLSNDN